MVIILRASKQWCVFKFIFYIEFDFPFGCSNLVIVFMNHLINLNKSLGQVSADLIRDKRNNVVYW